MSALVDMLDYKIASADARMLIGLCGLPAPARAEALADLARRKGVSATLDLFAQFIGLANAVAANNREMVEIILITDGDMHPHTAEKANLPTIAGALRGVALANFVPHVDEKMCGGCAYRLGTPANQSPYTTADAEYAGLEFRCHEDIDDQGNVLARRTCRGAALRELASR